MKQMILGFICLSVTFSMPTLLSAELSQGKKRLQPDFTFKSVKPPKAGERRIRVQISPKKDAPTQNADKSSNQSPPQASPQNTSHSKWFWSQISPKLTDKSADRLSKALAALKTAPALAATEPRLSTLKALAEKHGPDILAATINTNVSPALALAVIHVESAGQTDAISSAGATGLMQLMPATAERFGVQDAKNPKQNIKGGIAYLDWLLTHFDKDPLLSIAAYNAGEGSIRDHGGVPPYKETRAYVPKVLFAWKTARGLCKTQPELVTDACAFVSFKQGGE